MHDERNKNVLIHAYKYLYKKKVNGKWRYYYEIPTGIEKDLDLTMDYSEMEDRMGADERDAYGGAKRNYERALATAKEKINAAYGNDNKYADKARGEALAELEKAGEEYMKAQDQFYKTPLGKIHNIKEKIAKGAKAVTDFFKSAKELSERKKKEKAEKKEKKRLAKEAKAKNKTTAYSSLKY